MKKLSKILFASSLFAPSFVLAAATFASLLTTVNSLVGQIVPILMAAAFAYFVWGIVKYLMASADDIQGKGVAKTVMINGVIALFVMVSVWGLVVTLQKTFGLDSTSSIKIHGIP